MNALSNLINVSDLVFKDGYAPIEPSLIPNTEMKVRSTDGGVTLRTIWVKPISGYVLHDNTLDIDVFDEKYENVIGKKFGYSPSCVYVTCGASYDFTTHTVTDENGNTCTAYGNREFFAKLESEVPADQIFGVDNDREASPTMTLLTDTEGAVVECEYNRDSNAVIADLYNKIAEPSDTT